MSKEWVGTVLDNELTETTLESLGYLEVNDSKDTATFMKQITKKIRLMNNIEVEKDCYIFIDRNTLTYSKNSVDSGKKFGWCGEKITLEEHWAITNKMAEIIEE